MCCNAMGEMALPQPQSLTTRHSCESSCEHCGTLFAAAASERFCCVGCEFVFGLIQSKGLDHYYEIRAANPPTCPLPILSSLPDSTSSAYAFCDDAEFIEKYSPDGLRLRFYLDGMSCTACLWLLEKLPVFCADAESARVNMSTSTIEVRRNSGASFAAIARALHRIGYRPHPLSETETSAELQRRERRKDLIRLGAAGVLTGNIMILAVSLYGGAVGELAEQFRWLSALLALPVLTYCAWPFYKNAIAGLRSRYLNLDVPIVVAVWAGIVMSVWELFNGHGAVYFDSLSMLVFLLLASRYILKGVQIRQMQTTHLQDEIFLGTVHRQNPDGTTEAVSSLALAPGDLIRISGEVLVPVDGAVVAGAGLIDTAVMTGESTPVEVVLGSLVEAGSQSLSGVWTLAVTKTPAQTRLAQILRDTEVSSQSKSLFVHFSDRISTWFITVVLILAAALVLIFWSSDLHEGLSRALALVIVTCPCVFGMAIPLSMSLAIRSAARQGIVVKNADAIEKLWKVKSFFLDKTGTLTTGKMKLLKTDSKSPRDLQIALGLEMGQSHPVARALTQGLRAMGVESLPVEGIQAVAFGGLSGRFEGATYTLRSAAPEGMTTSTTSLELKTSYALFRNDELRASFQLDDEIRSDAAAFLAWARKARFSTEMLSGDRDEVVARCGRILGFAKADIHSRISPEIKAALVHGSATPAAMIGDGANDAAALASATVGIAVCGSLDVSLRAADVYLTRPRLALIRSLFELAELTRGAIYRNLVFSVSFNLVAGFLALSGRMTPLWAAVLMPVSSLTVLFSSLWTGRQLFKTGEKS
jgi:heavy metal translocating P-type ATPase